MAYSNARAYSRTITYRRAINYDRNKTANNAMAR